jgi:DNA-binding NarL/FixJ family response regulator
MSKRRPSAARGLSDLGEPDDRAEEMSWQKRLFRNSYTRDGQRYFLEGWCVKIQHQGQRRTFSLGVKSKEQAAAEAKAIHETILTDGWEATLLEFANRGLVRTVVPEADASDCWKDRLLVRRYLFPASTQVENDFAARIDNGGVGYWFPLGTSDSAEALLKAQEIQRRLTEDGWDSVCRKFSRELIVGLEWCSNPILWTYTTIHTLVSAQSEQLSANSAGKKRVLLVESDAGVRRALQWCVNQQAEFQCVSCDTAESFSHAFSVHRPHLVLLNRNLAERLRFATPGRVSEIQKGIAALTYSVAVDGDQLFVSTPGGANGYLLKRAKPTALFEPILKNTGAPSLSIEEIDRSVKNYFKDSLLPRSMSDGGALSQLTSREQEVLALMSKGCVDKEIAQALGISAWTVHGHIKKIFERLGVRTRTEAVVRYLEK